VKSTASSNDIQKKNRVLKYIILFCFVFLKDFAFFSSFSSSSFFFFFFFFVEVEFGVDSIWEQRF
jgi:hypothetical protein